MTTERIVEILAEENVSRVILGTSINNKELEVKHHRNHRRIFGAISNKKGSKTSLATALLKAGIQIATMR